jgi:hypothetical protein
LQHASSLQDGVKPIEVVDKYNLYKRVG